MINLVILSFFLAFTCLANELTVGTSFSVKDPSKIGPNKRFELEIVNEVFRLLNITPKYYSYELKDIFGKLAKGEVEVGMTLKSAMGGGIYYSDSYVEYQNVVISLKKNNIKVKDIAALGEHSVGTFQNAKKFLGREFGQIARGHDNYKEFFDQAEQVEAFFKGDIDVFVGDINIFYYYKNIVSKRMKVDQEVDYHEIFPKTQYQVGFRDKILRDKFNKALDELKRNGFYHKTRSNYTKILKGHVSLMNYANKATSRKSYSLK